MNTFRQGVYVSVLLAALASVVAVMMMALASRPEPYTQAATEAASHPVLGPGSRPDCVVDESISCSRPEATEVFDLSRAMGLMERANPVLELEDPTDESVPEDDPATDDEDADTDQGDEEPTTTSTTQDTTTTTRATTQPTANPDDDAEQPTPDQDDDRANGEGQDDETEEASGGGGDKQPTTTQKQNDNRDKADADTGSSEGADLSEFEQTVINLANKHRRRAGCEPLIPNDALNRSARAHSVNMAKNKFFAHQGLDGSSPGTRAMDAGYSSPHVAANIAWGFRSPKAVVNGWMDSEDHRNNILDCRYVDIGVGFHKHYWTQNFGIPN